MITFNQFGLKDELVQAVTSLGFNAPTPIQQQTIPLLINEETDVIALAQTGTGKTAAFGLPLLHRLDESERGIQALVLSPTRELCIQIKDELVKYSQFMDNTSIVAVFGGASITEQIRNIKKGAQIIVATPGRLIDLLDRKALKLDNISTIVLDEADEMLNMGFRDDIETILEASSNRNESWLFSATMNNDVRRIAKKFMNDAAEVAVAKENVGNENIHHQYYVVQSKYRYDALQRLLDVTPDIYGIIFTRTKQDAHDISEKLVKDGYAVSALHGDLDQNMRSKVMARFKNKQLDVIVATDVAARGIDVNDITHVINFELPDDPEVYTHRSGRTARAGKTGVCISICSPRDISKIRRIEKIVSSKFDKMNVPDGQEVIKGRLFHFLEKVEKTEPSKDFATDYSELVHEKLNYLSNEELINRLLWLQLSQTIETYQDSVDLNVGVKEKDNSNNTNLNGTVRLFINLGKKDGLTNKKLADFVADSIDFDYKSIDRVTVTELSSYFNVPEDTVEYIKDNLSQQKFNGRKIRVDEAEDKSRGGSRERRGGGDRDRRSSGDRDRRDRGGFGGDRDRRSSDRRDRDDRGFRGGERRDRDDRKGDFKSSRKSDDFKSKKRS